MSSQASYDAYRRRELLRLRRSLIRLQDEALLLRRDIRAGKYRGRKFNPDQPRVPAGNAGGGKWTSGSGGGGSGFGLGSGLGGGLGEFGMGFGEGWGLGESMGEGLFVDQTGEASWSSFNEAWSEDGSIFERDIVNRDGSTIQSEYAASREAGFDERQTVRLASGETVSFETTDRVQTIRYGGEVVSRSLWTASGPERDAAVQPAFAPMVAAPAIIIGGAILFGWESQRNGIGGGQAVMGFNAQDFRPGANARGILELTHVGRLSEDEVARACLRWPDVKVFADRAANAAGSSDLYSSAAVYGTSVHTRFKTYVDDTRDPRFRAERSFFKEADENRDNEKIPYGSRGTIRVDAYEYHEDGTLCVYDLKTGRADLSDRRAEILATAAAVGFKPVRRIIVSVIRPKT